MSEPLTFQDAVLRLQGFWAEAGCLLWQPYNTEVGAGTMNPATYLRVLGPEPWNVGYVEPSVRPDDSRYGDKPNRVQMHTQYQVILKPDPGNPQELYLASLEALGIDRSKHDIRFVEDNWESPALGAWGLGWEVWLDGLEITQFTYFQQAGGFTVDPVAVEITYGLERILMALQGADHFKKIRYNPALEYGELFGQNEYEMSVYNLDAAGVERVAQLFNLYEGEALAMPERRLPIPAYNYVLKTSHAFNVLDSRGAIGVTERARYFARMRDLARKVAALWVERREELGHPLGRAEAPKVPLAAMPEWPAAQLQDFLLEIGTEELPPADLDDALEQLRKRVPALLDEARLAHGAIVIDGTPRRLAVFVADMAARQADLEYELKGPPARVAFDAQGKPTKAAEGFARKAGAALDSIERREIDGGEYLVARVREAGRPAGQALAEALPGLVAGLAFGKSMRWNWTNAAFSRPLRWIVALLGAQVVPFEYAGAASGRATRNVRNAAAREIEIPSAGAYARAMEEAGIVLSVERRREAIWAEARRLAAQAGGRLPEETRGALLAEVANLVESPTPLLGAFEEQYLELPREVLATVMRKHQRYFPIENEKGELLPRFVAVANGRIDPAAVRAGNEAVLRARYADAAFFWQHDIAKTLEEFRPALSGLMFQAKLGSMLDKSERIEQLAPALADWLGLSAAEKAAALRAAHLAKADLVTQMVIELTSLAGQMGRRYALKDGEPPEVAEAIFECALPRFAGDALPRTKAGATVALADRLDSLAGLFAVGLAPRSAADPFALRRAALGIVQTLIENGIDLDLRQALRAAAALQPVEASEQCQAEALEFIARRLEQWWLDGGARHDLVRAVLAERGHNPAGASRLLDELAAAAPTERFGRILTAYSRPARIVRGQTLEAGGRVDPALFEQDEEKALHAACETAAAAIRPAMRLADFLDAFEPLCEPIGKFFDEVFVMVEDERIKANRLALLKRIADLAGGIADFSKIEGF